MAQNSRDLEAAIAATRFGLGARPGEIAQAARDPKGLLKAQIRREGADIPKGDGETSTQRYAEFVAYRRERQMSAGKEGDDAVKAAQQFFRRKAPADALARAQLAAATDAGFRERWALFWANHFTVSAIKVQVAGMVGPYETEAIRPHVFGRFEDLLGAAESHPAMLLYLDQARSIGPRSPLATRIANRRIAPLPGAPEGLNENLAREILELHTVGVDGGYTQADVTEFARALTGLTVGRPNEGGLAGESVFREAAHEPGVRTVMGVRYPQSDKAQANAVLRDLASKPQTARFISTKIARHFVADDPPPSLVARLEKTWLESRGDLGRVAETLIDAPEAWAPQPAKFKTPYEFVVSCWRAVGAQPQTPQQLGQVLTGLGQRPFGAPSPKGWPDEASPWAASDALVKRMQFAQALAAGPGARVDDPKGLAAATLGARLSPASATAIARAESRAEAVALLFMTPEFQRR